MDDEIFDNDAVTEEVKADGEDTIGQEVADADDIYDLPGEDPQPDEPVPVLSAYYGDDQEPQERPKWSKKKKITVIVLIVLAALIVIAGICVLVFYVLLMAILKTSTIIVQSIAEELVTDLAEGIVRGLSDVRIF